MTPRVPPAPSGADPVVDATPPRSLSPRLRAAAVHGGWISVFSLLLTVVVERFGFSPTDQGFMLAQSWRVLHGERPHVDILSARPLGSAYLHVVDFASPAPLFVSSIFISCAEMTLATALLYAWARRSAIRDLGAVDCLVIAAATAVNIHLNSMGSWHTIDGMLLVALGAYAATGGSRSRGDTARRIGFLCIGASVVTKQSFFLAVVVAAAAILVSRRRSVRSRALDLLALSAVPVVYVVAVALLGGFAPMLDQFSSAGQTVGLFSVGVQNHKKSFLLVAVYACAFAAAVFLRPRAVRAVASVSCLCLLALLMARGNLASLALWAVELWWILAVSVLVVSVRDRRVPIRLVGILLLGVMVSLSWGDDSPSRIGGTMLVACICLVPVAWPTSAVVLRVRALAVIALCVGVIAWMGVVRLEHPYFDRPSGELTEDLGDVAAPMRGMRTTKSMALYVSEIRDCIQRYPADRVAVYPDNPFVYPAFRVRNAFSVEWPLSIELVGDARSRLVDEARALDARGGYLVVFETVSNADLVTLSFDELAAKKDVVYDPPGVSEGILRQLTGEHVQCGHFIGVWSPKR